MLFNILITDNCFTSSRYSPFKPIGGIYLYILYMIHIATLNGSHSILFKVIVQCVVVTSNDDNYK